MNPSQALPRTLPLIPTRSLTLLLMLTLLAVNLPLIAALQPAPRPWQPPALPAGLPPETLPLVFEPNAGQHDPAVRLSARALGGTVFFTPDEVVLTLPAGAGQAVLRLAFAGAAAVEPVGEAALPGTVSYLLGNDQAAWRSNLSTYGSVSYPGLYPGIDLRYDGAGGQLKSTYTVAPGVNPAQIRWGYEGASNLRLDGAGNLVVELPGAPALVEQVPIAWQEIDGQQVPVDVRFDLGAGAQPTVGFALGGYDPAHTLIIDPSLTYGSYLGGNSNDSADAVAVGRDGSMYLLGTTRSTNFPRKGGLPNGPNVGVFSTDLFISRISADGKSLLFSTYLGGTNDENRHSLGGIAVDAGGNIYITGDSFSRDFPRMRQIPHTSGALESSVAFNGDMIVAKLTPTGSALVYSSLLGASGSERGHGIAVDAEGHAYIGGIGSGGFPLVSPLYSREGNEGLIVKIAPEGNRVAFATHFGSTAPTDVINDIALDPAGNIVVVGNTTGTDLPLKNQFMGKADGTSFDVFVAKFRGDGRELLYSTYFGGAGSDEGESVAVDGLGQITIAGSTNSTDLPVANAIDTTFNGRVDSFVTRFTETGNALVYSTYLGGTRDENFYSGERTDIAVDEEGSAYLTGSTDSVDFPLLSPLPGNPITSATTAAFITKIGPYGAMVYSTLYGGEANDAGHAIAVDAAGAAYVVGDTASNRLPTVNPVQSTRQDTNGAGDAFIARVAHGPGRTAEIGPKALTFPATKTGVASDSQSFVIANVGQQPLQLINMILHGANASEFTITANSCVAEDGTAISVQPGKSCRIAVSFKPSASGQRNARLAITAGSWLGPRSVALKGMGRPSVVLQPEALQFTYQSVNTTSQPQALTLRNIGTEPFTLGATTVGGINTNDFSLGVDNCSGKTVPAGGTCTVEVKFTPRDRYARFGEISFNSSIFTESPMMPVQGVGGDAPALTVSQEGNGDENSGDVICSCIGREVVITGSNFPLGSVQFTIGSASAAPQSIGATTVGESGGFTHKFMMPEVKDGGILTITATSAGLPQPVTAQVRTPRTDGLPIIFIPGHSASVLEATADFVYVAPPAPELLDWLNWTTIIGSSPLRPETHVVLNGHIPWLDTWSIARIFATQYRYVDMLRLKADGVTPETDMLGTTPQIGVKDVLWAVDLPVIEDQDFYANLRGFLLGEMGYVKDQNFFAFPYDWRKDVTGTAADLDALINRAMQASGKDKVVIISHSFGGLVARNYMAQYGTDKVDQAISIGTPYLGAPKATKVLELGDEWGIAKTLGPLRIGMHPGEMKRIARNFPSAYQLAPPRLWFENTPSDYTEGNLPDAAYLVRESYIDGRVVKERLDYGATMQFISERHNGDLARIGEQFHDQRLGDMSYLTDQYYAQRIIGQGLHTLSGVEYSRRRTCATIFGKLACLLLPEFGFPKEHFWGDGTVPFYSAMGANVRDHRYYTVNNPSKDDETEFNKAEHNSLPRNTAVQGLIKQMLAGKLCDNRQPLAGASGLAAAGETAAFTEQTYMASGTEVAVIGSSELSIYDAQGRLTGRVPGSTTMEARFEIPGVSYQTANGVQVAMLPAGEQFTVKITSVVTGVAQLQINNVETGDVTKSARYEGVAMKPGSTIEGVVGAEGAAKPPVLTAQYEQGGPTQSVPAPEMIDGAELQDLTPPTVTLSVDGGRTVTIAAQDEQGGTGLDEIYYTTDKMGGEYLKYTGPFQVPAGAAKIMAFATDKAGNSGEADASLAVATSYRVNLPMIRR